MHLYASAFEKLQRGGPRASCDIEVGLAMAPAFRDAVITALAVQAPPTADVVIARAVDGAIV